MAAFKQNLKQITPQPIWQSTRTFWNALQNASLWPLATLHPWRRRSIRRLAELKDIHKDQRCFIIGNGPSLKQTDLTRLRQEYTFGMNRIYLGFQEMGFETSYFLTINSLVIEQCAAEIRSLRMPRFVSWRSRRLIGIAPDLNFLHTTYTGPKFARDARGRLWEGATVTYVAMQLAYHMGFRQVILIGIDHNYSAQGKPNTTVTSQGDDQDHFNASYFGKGFRWQLPDLETSERSYQLARQSYEQSGRQILDATIGGKLTVFPKVDYDSLF
jgi:6-hydroxymethylpterin diphosphokinase MptE-like